MRLEQVPTHDFRYSRAMHRLYTAFFLTLAVTLAPARAEPIADAVADSAHMTAFLDALWVDARKQGITRATFDRAFAGFTPDPRVIAATHREPEYGKPVGDYVNAVASTSRIAEGAAKAAQWAGVLDATERQYGVERWIVLALWGIESFVRFRPGPLGRDPLARNPCGGALPRSLFSQREPDRAAHPAEGRIARERMLGSWAGAMASRSSCRRASTPMRSNFTGDGRRDIWTSVPDVLASIANYLARSGWQRGLPWGYEVALPRDFDYRRARGSFADWTQRGVRRADGGALPRAGDGFLLFPSGAAGPAFLVTTNFNVIKTYNNSDVYALGVGHLADRMHGRAPFRAAWPKDDPQLSRDARMALQHKLARVLAMRCTTSPAGSISTAATASISSNIRLRSMITPRSLSPRCSRVRSAIAPWPTQAM